MIDGRGLDLARPRGGGEQQQREAVRTAGHGDADRAPGAISASRSREIGREALEDRSPSCGRGPFKRVGTADPDQPDDGRLAHQLHCAWALASASCFLRSGRTFAP